MPRITEILIIDEQEKPIIYIYKDIKREELHDFLDKSFLELLDYVKKGLVFATDLPFIHIVALNEVNISVIAGIPITDISDKDEKVKSSIIPATKCLMTYFQGSFDSLQAYYEILKHEIAKNGYEMIAKPYEYYLNDKRFDSDQLITKILVPIKEKNAE